MAGYGCWIREETKAQRVWWQWLVILYYLASFFLFFNSPTSTWPHFSLLWRAGGAVVFHLYHTKLYGFRNRMDTLNYRHGFNFCGFWQKTKIWEGDRGIESYKVIFYSSWGIESKRPGGITLYGGHGAGGTEWEKSGTAPYGWCYGGWQEHCHQRYSQRVWIYQILPRKH